MNEILPLMRKDLEFFPVKHGGQQLILIRDHLGLVQEGKAVAPSLYQVMILLDGTRTIRDLQNHQGSPDGTYEAEGRHPGGNG